MIPLKILHLEDNAHDAALVEATLAADGLDTEIVRVDRREAFEAALGSRHIDLILADNNLPTFDGASAQISPAKLALLFQPFERLGAEQSGVEGTGLGLALSRGLAEAMGGSLGVRSAVDRGSTFWIDLATCEGPHPRAGVSQDKAPLVSPREIAGTVLYVEDNRSNVRLMERVLERRPGVRLLHAPDGAEGLRRARADHPNPILLDLHLPDMTGEEVLDRMWQDPDLGRIPIAVLSADAAPEQARRLKASGAVAYLTKPIEIIRIMTLLDEWLAGSGSA